MPRRVFLLAACAALLNGAKCDTATAPTTADAPTAGGSTEVTYVRPNEAEECGTEPMDFLAYAEGLEQTTCSTESCTFQEQSATLFDITYYKDYKVIEYTTSPELEATPMTAATYILYQCGQEEPSDDFIQGKLAENASEVQFIQIPLTAVATEDATVGWFLEELGVLDRVRFGAALSTSPCMQKLTSTEADGGCDMAFIGEYDYTDAEPTAVSAYDVKFSFQSSTADKEVFLLASADPGPLARAEHIVYLSAFFNLEATAMQYYNTVSDSYNDKAERKLAEIDDTTALPTVAWLTTIDDVAFYGYVNAAGETIAGGSAAVISFARYKALLTRDAGGEALSQSAVVETEGAFASLDDIIFAASEYTTNASFVAALQSALTGVDVLIDETYHFDISTATEAAVLGFLGLNGTDVSPVDFPFLANGEIWRHDKGQSVTGSDEWFGEAVARPDYVHADLEELITPGSLPNHTFKFFRNISKGQNVTVVGLEDCTDLECTAYENQEALIAGATVDAIVAEEDVVDDSGAGHVLFDGAVAAGAVFAALLAI